MLNVFNSSWDIFVLSKSQFETVFHYVLYQMKNNLELFKPIIRIKDWNLTVLQLHLKRKGKKRKEKTKNRVDYDKIKRQGKDS